MVYLRKDVQVSIVTGYAGCGFELAKILYQRNGTVYLAGRNRNKGLSAVKNIQEQFPKSEGYIEFLEVDLADLSSIKPAIETFLSKSNTLHCLTNNAGVMATPDGSKTVQVNVLYLKRTLMTMLTGAFLVSGLRTPDGHELSRSLSLHEAASTRLAKHGSFIASWSRSRDLGSFSRYRGFVP